MDDRWQRIEELFHASADLAPAERSAFLARACDGDDELRIRVEALLAQDAAQENVFEAAVKNAAGLVGQHVGPYVITGLIGKGGMGEVYRAHDARLDRDVAIKRLPAALAQDPERLARFTREAKVLASLNHPNIAQIYGVEDRALVMELVAGHALKGPLPLETALSYACQIASALEAAHDKGIVHRDLKPANVMVTPEGVVKVLDFGLAAVAPAAADDSNPTKSPTLTMQTRTGVIMGTAAYMSPEQAAGKAVDKRADIWSFGAVLWEMLTGRALFEGETVSHTLADVLRGPIDFDKLPRETPAGIRGLVRRCLDRNAKNRLRDIGEARVAIDGALSGEPAETPSARRSIAPWAVAAALAVACSALGAGLWRATRPLDRPLMRLDVDLGPEVAFPDGDGNLALSPDGARLAYVSGDGGRLLAGRLYTRRFDQSKPIRLPGTEGADFPFFLPDGQWVGFSAANKLNKISVEGGAVVPLADLPSMAFGASWGSDDNIIVGGGFGLMRIPASRGAPTKVLEVAPGEIRFGFPQVLPGGKAVLFVALYTNGTTSVDVFSVVDRRRKTLVKGGAFAHYVSSGHLIYTIRGKLFGIAFDVGRLETRGTAVAVLDDVAYDEGSGPMDVDCTEAGTLVYFKGSQAAASQQTIQWVDAAGKKEPLRAEPRAYQEILRVSPDGKRLSFAVFDNAGSDVWVYDPQRDAMTRLTFSGAGYSPIWTPDGRYIVFGMGLKGIFWTRSDGAGQPQPLTQGQNDQRPLSITRDGMRLAYTDGSSSGNSQIWTLPLEEQAGQLKAGKPEQFLKSQFDDGRPAFSPDGRWLAYRSNESGKLEVYVRAFPAPASGQGGKWQISNDGGSRPLWSGNGRQLFYQAGQALDQLMVVDYSVDGGSFVAEKPRVWIEKLPGADIDLAPDGKRVAVLVPVETPESSKPAHEVTFVFNFLDELRRRVPVK